MDNKNLDGLDKGLLSTKFKAGVIRGHFPDVYSPVDIRFDAYQESNMSRCHSLSFRLVVLTFLIGRSFTPADQFVVNIFTRF